MNNNQNIRILGITLARGGSKSVPRKNIKPIVGVPLIEYTISEAYEILIPKIKNNPALERSVQASQAYKDLEEEINRTN